MLLLQDAHASHQDPADGRAVASWQDMQAAAGNPHDSPLLGAAAGVQDLTAAGLQVRQQRPRQAAQYPLVPGEGHFLERLKSGGLGGVCLYLDRSAFYDTYEHASKVDNWDY
jgi:hypothetical protein